jgi:hypothetical protein
MGFTFDEFSPLVGPQKRIQSNSYTGHFCEKYASHLSDFEPFLLWNDGQPKLLHHKIEKKKNPSVQYTHNFNVPNSKNPKT